MRDAIARLVDERDELYFRSIDQQAQIERLKKRLRAVEDKRERAREKIAHLIQQLPQ